MTKNTSRTYTVFALALLFMLGSVVLVVGLTFFVRSEAQTLNRYVRDIAYAEATESTRYDTTRLLEETAEERAELAAYVLTEDSVIDFITEIERSAAARGLDFSTESIEPIKTKDEFFDQISLQFSFSGTPAAAIEQLAQIETIPYHCRIKTVAVQHTLEGEMKVKVILLVSIREYET